MALRSGNPALRANTFSNYTTSVTGDFERSDDVMTLSGAVNKTALALVFCAGGAGVTWNMFLAGKLAAMMSLMWGGLLAATILGFVTIFWKKAAPYLTLPYAVCEGFALGGISAAMNSAYPGIVMQAVGATFGTLLCLLAAYRSGMIKPTENFKLGLVAAMGGLMVLLFGSALMNLAGFHMPAIYSNGPMGIVFSLVVVVIAALNLVLDFDFIEQGAEQRAPKFLEWYAAFGLMVTLIWLYLEILNLLAKLQGGNRR